MALLKQPAVGEPITVTINKAEYQLRFPLRVVRQLEERFKMSVLRATGIERIFSEISVLVPVLAAGLKKNHPEIDEDWVDDNVDASQMMSLGPYVAFALSGNWPQIPGVTIPPRPTGANGTTAAAIPPQPVTPADEIGLPSGHSAAAISGLQTNNSGT